MRYMLSPNRNGLGFPNLQMSENKEFGRLVYPKPFCHRYISLRQNGSTHFVTTHLPTVNVPNHFDLGIFRFRQSSCQWQ